MTDIERPLRILHLIDEIIRHITFGYTVRGACLAVGVAPSTGYRWLKQYYHIKEDDHARHRRSGETLRGTGGAQVEPPAGLDEMF